MNTLSTILLCFFISEISAYNYTLTEIKGIDIDKSPFSFGIVSIEFQTDAKGNAYAFDRDKFYKLNSSNEITLSITFPCYVEHMFVSSVGDVYFIYWHQYKYNLTFLRAGSTKIQQIGQITSISPSAFHNDNNGNFIYKNEGGIYVFRPHYNASVLIKNLEGYKMDKPREKATDKSGNTYLSVTLGWNHTIAQITKQSLEEEIPRAVIIPYNQSNPGFTYIKDVVVDDEDNLWVTHVDDLNQYQVSKFEEGNFKTLLTLDRKKPISARTMPSKGKVYLTAYNYENRMVESLHLVTSNGEAVEIIEFKNFSASNFDMFGVSDSEGQVYFFNVDSSNPAAAVTIKQNETKPIPITFPTSRKIFDFNVKLDFNDNLWVFLPSGIYHLKKGETVPLPVPQLQKLKDCYCISINSVTKKIYFSCTTGIYVFE